MVNTERFPDLKEMTDHGHKLGLTVGWYFNNCYRCHEKCPASRDMMEDPLYPFVSRVAVKPPSWNHRIYLAERSGIIQLTNDVTRAMSKHCLIMDLMESN